MFNLCSFLNWLRDPFGTKKLNQTHTTIRRRMVETTVRAEDTTKLVQRFPMRRAIRRNPIEKVVVGNRTLSRKRPLPHVQIEDGPT